MSDEESETDEHGKKILRSIPWRNFKATDLIKRNETDLGVKRVYGMVSAREPTNRCMSFIVPSQLQRQGSINDFT